MIWFLKLKLNVELNLGLNTLNETFVTQKLKKLWFKMKLRDSLDCKQGAVRAIRYNIDGDYILTCGSNKTVKLWNAKTFVSTLLINRS